MSEQEYFSREKNIFQLENQTFDLVVIGGGITGAGIVRDAIMRGLKVALVEAKDFASGTSSKSSKLLHGGIRYLEKFQLGLVFEASYERKLHREFLSPHLVQPVPFLIPVYSWSPHGLPAIAAGVWLYEALSLFHNFNTKISRREKTLELAPLLEQRGLKGSAIYYDVAMDDARLNLEVIHNAVFHGAVAANYVNVRGFQKDSNSKISGVWVRDVSPLAQGLSRRGLSQGKDFLIKTKLVVNATGPWVDYIRRLDNPRAQPILRPTKGIHLVLPNEVTGKKFAYVLTAKKDNRVFFSIPWFGRTLIGTTDTDYREEKDGKLDDLRANANEVDYLLENAKRVFPSANFRVEDIQATFAGVRPLVAENGGLTPSAISREHKIIHEESGLFTIAGGKYTTYRVMAKQMVDAVIKTLQRDYSSYGLRSFPRCMTNYEQLVITEPKKIETEMMQKTLENYSNTLGEVTIAHLQKRYGLRWFEVAEIASANRSLAEAIIPGEPDILAEAQYAHLHEMALSLEDFLRRRTMLALRSPIAKYPDRLDVLSKIIYGHDVNYKPSKEEVLHLQGLDFKR